MTTPAPEAPLVASPIAKHTASVILIHAIGDTGEGWRGVAERLSKDVPHVKWIFPHAPTGEVTAYNKKCIPRWFDISSYDFDKAEENRGDMFKAASMIDQLVQKEVDAGIPPERVVIGGFSQGGAVALLTSLTSRPADGFGGGKEGWKVAGIVVVSGWLPFRNDFQQFLSPHAAKTPIFWGHGTDDNVVRYKFADTFVKKLTSAFGIPMAKGELGSPGLSFRTYKALGHQLCAREERDLSEFLRRVIPPL
ncbi:Phospholipase/carboxylesterase/thioesterase [Scleroderma citrinum]